MRVLVGGSIDRPEVVPAESPITARHLLMHTSGFVYPTAQGSLIQQLYAQQEGRDHDIPLASVAQILSRLPLAHQPGQAWHYGLSLDLLGHLIEVISGTSFDQFLAERLFGPLGMGDTGFCVPAGKADRYAACYGANPEGGLDPVHTPFDVVGETPAFLSGGGGLLSTAYDYGRFCQMLLNGGELDGARILGRKTVELMTRNHTPASWIPVVPPSWPFREGYGMAFGVRTIVDVAATGQPGSLGTFTWQGAAGTDFWVDPVEGLYGVLMAQILPGDYGPAQDLRVLTYQALAD
jgi:CubicO group peptidase (beta-lactamase class C family)